MTRDRHVLKAALESGKKPSNKQLEKLATQVSSRASSKAVSAANSRVASRAASEDGDSDTNDLDRRFVYAVLIGSRSDIATVLDPYDSTTQMPNS